MGYEQAPPFARSLWPTPVQCGELLHLANGHARGTQPHE